MALNEAAIKSLAGLWGSYDFYLIRDRHFKTASDLVERFLEIYQPRWKKSSRATYADFAQNQKQVRELLTEWAEKKIAVVTENESLPTLQSNIMFKQLLYGQESINFGSIGTNWKKKVEIASELAQYKPWSVAHAAATLGGRKKLRKHMESILAEFGTSRERSFFEGWWDLTDDEDRPMLFPQVWGHTTGKLWLQGSNERTFPAFFSFGLVNVVSRSKVLMQCEPKSSKLDADAKSVLAAKRNLAAGEGWLLFEFTASQLADDLSECFDAMEDCLHY
jgi:hypothetical protein